MTRPSPQASAYHPPQTRGAPASAEGARDDFAACAAVAWRGGGIGRNFLPMHTGHPLGKVEVAVLARWASVEYTRPLVLPKEKVFARRRGRDVCSETAAWWSVKTEA